MPRHGNRSRRESSLAYLDQLEEDTGFPQACHDKDGGRRHNVEERGHAYATEVVRLISTFAGK